MMERKEMEKIEEIEKDRNMETEEVKRKCVKIDLKINVNLNLILGVILLILIILNLYSLLS